MPAEKAQALVLRTTDWSETSRIASLWTREFGKVRVLAKGGRRLKSNFENALDLLTHCSIVFLRKSPGSLDLLTEAQVVRRFPRLHTDLAVLYAGYYVAELLEAMTEEHDPHPLLFDSALEMLNLLGSPDGGMVGDHAPTRPPATGPCVARFELVLLQEVGYSPALERCASCGGAIDERRPAFSCAAGGLVCPNCAPGSRDRRQLSPGALEMLRALQGSDEARRRLWDAEVRREVRLVLGQYVTYLLGRRPRLLPYLGS
ncbi:MAG TPA: DNA repair protein RecO [Gemmataceae bacterium]|nr:DNA repair protein RecO [Gemmataceae bacterium]